MLNNSKHLTRLIYFHWLTNKRGLRTVKRLTALPNPHNKECVVTRATIVTVKHYLKPTITARLLEDATGNVHTYKMTCGSEAAFLEYEIASIMLQNTGVSPAL
jgi:hypothetical protein